ncbi:hypothetical protein ACHIPZ_11025 [Antrihabitans sp. NCIMB 15449]|uniref:Uncharacterized protein n=1 Tax=Antrihabitans spumae TaxID=3373370 RepID=A0ABW7JNS2_9NOCA
MNSATGVTRVRGASVGAVSGSFSLAAHAAASSEAPSEGAITLLLAMSAGLGALVATLSKRHRSLRDSSTALVGALVLGQALGHLTLSVASDHHHGPSLTPTMLGAHAAAVLAIAVVIRYAEQGYRVAANTLARIVPRLVAPGPIAGPARRFDTDYRDDIIARLLVAPTLRTRAPPALA